MWSKDHEITFYSLVTATTRSVMFCGSGMNVFLCKRCIIVIGMYGGKEFFYFITKRSISTLGHP